jgi:hypothetical protein
MMHYDDEEEMPQEEPVEKDAPVEEEPAPEEEAPFIAKSDFFTQVYGIFNEMWDALPATKQQQLAAKYDLKTLERFFKSTLA